MPNFNRIVTITSEMVVNSCDVVSCRKAEKLKEKVQRCGDLLTDNDAWICQQQLRRIYQQVLIIDLEYALDRKVEQDLWSHGFKNYIASLQALTKDKKVGI